MNVPAADPDPAATADRSPDADDERARAERRRRLDAVFGDVLPDVTADERGPDPRSGKPGDDDWYLENRPPHHG